MPKGMDGQVDFIITPSTYLWGHKDGVFKQFQANAFKGDQGLPGEAGTAYALVDNAAASSDLFLNVGDTAFIDFTSATLVPLNIQTEEGLYEIKMYSINLPTVGSGPARFSPNNVGTNITIAYEVWSAYGTGDGASGGTTESALGFRCGEATTLLCDMLVTTATTNKCLNAHYSLNSNTQTNQIFYVGGRWTDTTTAWTSLGTLRFPYAQSGKVVIRRVI